MLISTAADFIFSIYNSYFYSYIVAAMFHNVSLTILGVVHYRRSHGGSGRSRHASFLLSRRRTLVVLSRFKVLDGFSVLVINQGHGDHCVPAVLLSGAPEIDLFIVCGHDGEIDELAGALHAVYFLDGLQFELLALGALLRVGVNVETVRGQDARLPLPKLE